MKTPVRGIHWKHCWRIIPTRYPSENLLDRVAAPKDLAAVERLDGFTSMRARQTRGEINFLSENEQASGLGSRYVMASFAYSLFNSSRFSDGSHGVYYCAKELHTAIAETKFHREEFMRHTSESPMMLSMRVLDAVIEGKLHDIRGLKRQRAELYRPASYAAAQIFARDLREQDSQGIVYDSVRAVKGTCAAIFKPALLKHCREERALIYEWDGRKIIKVYELQEFLELG